MLRFCGVWGHTGTVTGVSVVSWTIFFTPQQRRAGQTLALHTILTSYGHMLGDPCAAVAQFQECRYGGLHTKCAISPIPVKKVSPNTPRVHMSATRRCADSTTEHAVAHDVHRPLSDQCVVVSLCVRAMTPRCPGITATRCARLIFPF